MELNNNTLLGTYLAHIHSVVRRLSQLDFEANNHSDSPGEVLSQKRKEIWEQWEKLRSQLLELLDLKLKQFSELAGPGPFHAHTSEKAEGPRCLRYNFKKLKKMADKHRRRNPDFTFLKSWDIEEREPKEDYA